MKFSRRSILTKKIAFLDGLSGSGKSLVGPFISSLNRTEFWLFNHLYEEIVVLLANKKIDLDAAQAILRLHADMDLYNIALGRDINFREFDDSSVKFSLVEKDFKKRLKLKDTDDVIINLSKKNPLLLIMSHHILMYSKLIEKIFCDRLVYFFSLKRNPAKLIIDFHNNNWEEKLTKSKKQFIFTYKKNNKDYPWFIEKSNKRNESWIEKYADFVLRYSDYQNNFKGRNHFIINFDEFIQVPDKFLNKIEKIAGKKTQITNQLKKERNLPRKINKDDSKEDLENALSLIQSKKLKKKLISQFKDYITH
tara:strand:+ start:479 stop:1402 length:924 start_codon:yes stop_codon:yes gene_type:complete